MEIHNSLGIRVCHISGRAAIIPKITANIDIGAGSNIFVFACLSFRNLTSSQA